MGALWVPEGPVNIAPRIPPGCWASNPITYEVLSSLGFGSSGIPCLRP